MSTHHKPATALPFKVIEQRGARPGIYINGAEHAGSIAKMYNRTNWQADAAFIAHSANAYTKMVEALRMLTDLCDNVPIFQLDDGKASVKAVRLAGKFINAHRTAHALLQELGEAS